MDIDDLCHSVAEVVFPPCYNAPTMSDLLKNLNPEQAAAVTHRDGPLMIVAGAGTGKTTVVTKRIAYLIEQGLAKPQNILALTFTDKAAGEMEERVDCLLPNGYLELSISTFHAFCEKLLREYGVEIGLASDFHVSSELDAWLLALRNLEKFELDYYRPLGNPTKYLRGLLTHFSRAKDAAIDPLTYLAHADARRERLDDSDAEAVSDVSRLTELAKGYGTYQAILLENDTLDFGDLLMYTLKLLRERPRVLEALRRRYLYVLVDEFQDTNLTQYEIVQLIAAPRNNVTIVGDDDQAVYSWRGATIENILQFQTDYPDATKIVLTQNYRSVQKILDRAHAFIQANNPHRLEAIGNLDKRLVSNRKGEGTVEHMHVPTIDEETEAVAQKILDLRAAHPDMRWSDVAILTRSNAAAVPFLSTMERQGIPYQFMALRGLYAKPVVLDLVAYLRAIAIPHDSPSFYRVLAHPMRELSHLAIVELSQFAKQKGKSLFGASTMISEVSTVSAQTVETVRKLVVELEAFRRIAAHGKVSELFVKIVRDAGFVAFLNGLPEQDKVDNFRYLNQFYERLKRFEVSHTQPILRNFLDEYQQELDAGEEGSLSFDTDGGPDMVRVMTVHASKGLEFRFVFVVSMVDQRFPSVSRADAIGLPEGIGESKGKKTDGVAAEDDKLAHLEEERRLFYVAITRAKEQLFLTSADDYGGTRTRKLSRFLTELGFEKPAGRAAAKSDPFADDPAVPQTSAEEPVVHLPKQFSFTNLAAFNKCPLQYKFAHILKIPIFGRSSTSFGKTMHEALHQFLLGWQETPDLPVDDLLALFAENWQDDWYKDDAEREDFRRHGVEQLTAFHASLGEYPPAPAYLEQDFTIKFGTTIMKGRIDRIDTVEGGIEIIDYKTGTPKLAEKIEKADKEQLYLYQIAARDILGLNPVKLTYHYLQDNTRVSFLGEPDDLLDLQEKILDSVDKIKKSKFPPNSGFNCRFCDFKDICDFATR